MHPQVRQLARLEMRRSPCIGSYPGTPIPSSSAPRCVSWPAWKHLSPPHIQARQHPLPHPAPAGASIGPPGRAPRPYAARERALVFLCVDAHPGTLIRLPPGRDMTNSNICRPRPQRRRCLTFPWFPGFGRAADRRAGADRHVGTRGGGGRGGAAGDAAGDGGHPVQLVGPHHSVAVKHPWGGRRAWGGRAGGVGRRAEGGRREGVREGGERRAQGGTRATRLSQCRSQECKYRYPTYPSLSPGLPVLFI